ncbi:MAG: hypothetical protein WA738_22010 [Candidatus Angelobacter sp.]
MATVRIVSVGYETVLMGLRSQVLRQAGHAVDEAHTVRDALRLIEADSIDLLLICHSVPKSEQRWLIFQAREKRRLLPIVCIGHQAYVSPADGCVGIENSPGALLDAVKTASAPPAGFPY